MLDVVLGRLTRFSTDVIRPSSPLGVSADDIGGSDGDSERESVSTPAMCSIMIAI